MKRLATCLLLAIVAISHSIVAAEKSVAALELNIVAISPDGRIDVSLQNVTQKTLRVWQSWNSWGAALWRVLRISGGRLQTFFENPDRIFTKNFPAYDELPAGAKMSVTLDVNSREWRTTGNGPTKFERGGTVVVVYDVPWSDEASDKGVWHGFATALAAFN